jgi:hypothetical protein
MDTIELSYQQIINMLCSHHLTSLDLCQSCRGKCDFQILLYECDPFSPDPSEIARVTDYVVAYACKGNSTLTEEKRQMKQLVLR